MTILEVPFTTRRHIVPVALDGLELTFAFSNGGILSLLGYDAGLRADFATPSWHIFGASVVGPAALVDVLWSSPHIDLLSSLAVHTPRRRLALHMLPARLLRIRESVVAADRILTSLEVLGRIVNIGDAGDVIDNGYSLFR
jgi:hypothetical protein